MPQVLSLADRPTVPRAALSPRARGAPPPVFAYATTARHLAIPFPPVSFDPPRWRPLHARAAGHAPLLSRRPTALWRGSCNSLCDMMPKRRCTLPRDAPLLPRTLLLKAAASCPLLTDVAITSSHRN